MSNKVQTIIIGKDFEDAFNSICDLYRNKFISNKIISEIIDGKEIISGDGNIHYVFDPSYSSYGSEGELKIDSKGASWFKQLRDKEDIVSGANEWIDLLTQVANEYHKANSYLEFSQIRTELSSSEDSKHREMINKFFNVFYPSVSLDVANQTKEEVFDVFGVSIVMEVSLVGETQKVLGKIFFKRINDKYIPLKTNEAIEVKTKIDELMATEKSMFSQEEELKEENVINNILVEVEKLVSSGNFDKSIVLSNKKDELRINDMCEKGPQEFVELTCLSLNVLGMYHVNMISQYYELMYKSKTYFKASFNKNNELSIACLNCDSNEYICENNKISFEANGGLYEFVLDNTLETLVNPDRVQFIIENSGISKHGIYVSHNIFNKKCEKLTCLENIIMFNENKYCKDCPYPQIVYTDENGVSYATESLEYAFDKKKLIPKVDEKGNATVMRCKCCNRFFSADTFVNSKCPTCYKAFNATNETDNVYKKYRFIFPIGMRLKKNKHAYEDERMIVFNLNGKLYCFDKLKINDVGYIDKPRKEGK